ncbi:hypothetical protein BURMUCGD2_6350 [Burkholderia multivorans CGD2]|uniref:Uncharacterized protein n=1 Tax=Burkholderia multivorans CGD2 TaxID=513052 RepID=B9BNT0_9BURK|nr:hypothetical protein BURMUCGD2_6350 [Burkholderia multivorans CGD2]
MTCQKVFPVHLSSRPMHDRIRARQFDYFSSDIDYRFFSQ